MSVNSYLRARIVLASVLLLAVGATVGLALSGEKAGAAGKAATPSTSTGLADATAATPAAVTSDKNL